jgi:hypothetical protein
MYDNSDDIVDEFDWAFEDFADETGFLTNFSEYRLLQYQKAIELGKVMFPDIVMKIDEGWNSKYALFLCSEDRELSEWWEMFYTCK